MYNQKHIEDKDFIKEIEEKGEFLCKCDEHFVCQPNDGFYYYYKDRVYKVVKTTEYIPDKVKIIKDYVMKVMLKDCRENKIDCKEEDLIKYFNEDFENKYKSVVLDCVEENALSISHEVIYDVSTCDLFEKDLEKKMSLLNQLSMRFKMEDMTNNTTSALLKSETSINGVCLCASLDISDMDIDEKDAIIFKVKNTTSDDVYIEIANEKVGIAYDVIDEYREAYRIFSGSDKDNYFDVSIVFINNEKKGYMYGVLNNYSG